MWISRESARIWRKYYTRGGGKWQGFPWGVPRWDGGNAAVCRRNAAHSRGISPLCGVESAPIFFSLGKENGRGRSKEKRLGRGLWDVKSHRPAKAGVGFAEGVIGVGSLYRAARVWWMLWAAATIGPPKIKRLLSTPCCRSVAVEGASVSEEAPCLRRAAMGAVFGVRAADRTAIFRAHRPSGRERSEALARPRVLRTKTQIKNISFPPAAAHFLFQRKWGAALPPPQRGGKYRSAMEWRNLYGKSAAFPRL